MCRELRPEEYAFLVPILLIAKIVRLMCIAHRVEAGILDLLDTRLNLFVGEGMRSAKLVLIFTDSVDKYRLAVDKEAPVAVISLDRPRETEDTVGSGHLFGCLAVALDHCGEFIEIRAVGTPKTRILNG